MSDFEKPRWLKDLRRFLPLKPQFVLSGNVRDFQVCEFAGSVVPFTLAQTLAIELKKAGYDSTFAYDPVTGFYVLNQPGQAAEAASPFLEKLGLKAANGVAPAGIELFSETLDRIVNWGGAPIALIVDLASRLVVRTEALSAMEHHAFTRALKLSQQATSRPYGQDAQPFFNTVIWIADKEGDLPDWLLVENPRVRHIPIAKPDSRIRRELAKSLLRGSEPQTTALNDFVDQTEGLLLVDMTAISQLSRTEGVDPARIGDAVRRYKVGVTEDPWMRIDRSKVSNALEFIRRRIKGQDHAVTHMLDIVKRAVTGVGTPRRGGRPRGVAFLAGPTGVGKTELAKTITSLLFGDESAYVRFDMSEFSAEHSDQRLIGAPPGYIGYDVGGELTNAIREKPFCLALFDEIEKAHPRILDKFLQILDDGVLTSGRGDRVYFSEAFVVFTSNLGIYKTQSDGSRVENFTQADTFEQIQIRVRSEIDDYFKRVLNRPEILNRIGDNIVVFDFIRAPVADKIFQQMVQAVLDDVSAQQEIKIALNDAAYRALHELCVADLSNGGRGIRNKVESALINPLARALFDIKAERGSEYEVLSVQKGDTIVLDLVQRSVGTAAA